MAKKDIFVLADRMISFCDRHAVQYSSIIVTNGYFLDVETAEQLWSPPCTSAQVTSDGIAETHDKIRPLTSGRGSLQTIIDNISVVLARTPLSIALRVNVGQRNVDECDMPLDTFAALWFDKNKNFSVYWR